MKKVKYYYNRYSLRYEKIEDTFIQKVFRAVGFVSTTLLFAIFIIILAYFYIDSPKEKQLKREIAKMSIEYDLLNKKLEQMNQVLGGLEERDENIYRVIFEAEPIPLSVRLAGTGGSNKFSELRNYENSDIMMATAQKIDRISKQLYIQSKSYDEMYQLITDKEEMLASIPAIQPIANKDLKRVASGFGFRIHPIYKTRKMHYGLDFTAPTGTEIYCTGNGTVKTIKYSKRGLGNHVVVDHGFGYETFYAHMYRINVKRGQKVKRGDLLGTVGNTGTSTAPHLHYEVHKNGRKIDPINFFYNDLSPEEYEKVIELSLRHNQSFD